MSPYERRPAKRSSDEDNWPVAENPGVPLQDNDLWEVAQSNETGLPGEAPTFAESVDQPYVYRRNIDRD